jgi:hypothetical protein
MSIMNESDEERHLLLFQNGAGGRTVPHPAGQYPILLQILRWGGA